MQKANNNIIILTGPTGIGKTEISIQIAQNIPEIEIISADSMQIYKKMNIGTDKPKIELLRKYRHHGINLIDPSQDYNVMQYICQVKNSIKDIISRSKKPMIVGGTGLYLKSLTKPIFDGPGRNQDIRDRLNRILDRKGNLYLYNHLKRHDPQYAKKISPNDIRRIIRGLEVFYLTGKPLSSFHQNHENKNNHAIPKVDYHYYTICLYMNREKLYKKINERVKQMLQEGLIEETKELCKKYNYSNAMQALGYKQSILYLEGKISKEELTELIQKETRNFAKRQMSWFKNQLKVDCWINLDDYQNNLQQCIEDILAIIKNKTCY